MSRKPTLSPSKITTYLACPSKYRWTYVDERGRWFLRSKSYFSFGTTLHKVLQRFHDSGDTGVETVEQAVAAVEESWIDAGYRSAQEMQEARGEGKSIVAAYVEQATLAPTGAKTIMVEKQLRVEFDDFVLIGRLDRVDEWPDGTLEIIDYKSGRDHVTDEEVESDLAMACYQLMLHTLYPDRPIRASILALRSNTKGTWAMSDVEMEQFRTDLVGLGIEILNREYDQIDPSYRALCPSCDFLPLCRKHPDWYEPTATPSTD